MINKKYKCIRNCKYRTDTSWNSLYIYKTPQCSKFKEKTFYSNDYFPLIPEKWKAIFNENFKNILLPETSENGLVIVENRCDDRLKFVIQNIVYYIPNWKLHIFHSENNKQFIKNLLGKHIDQVVLHSLEHNIKTNQDYNKVLLDLNFWNQLSEHKHVLIFQTDTLLLRSGIDEFLKYDYIGSPWEWWFEHFNTYKRMGGNGGLSLRKISKMKEIITKHRTEKIKIPDYQNEDVFFSYHLFKDKTAKLPNWNNAMLFSSEAMLCAKTFGIHQAWKFHKNFELRFQKI